MLNLLNKIKLTYKLLLVLHRDTHMEALTLLLWLLHTSDNNIIFTTIDDYKIK